MEKHVIIIIIFFFKRLVNIKGTIQVGKLRRLQVRGALVISIFDRQRDEGKAELRGL